MSAEPFPETIIIVGAGIFGLSTALAIAHRYPSTRVTVIDRLTPPVKDGTSVDTTRCIRSDYADRIYARLALKAQQKIKQDPDLSRYYFQQGMSFVTDGEPGHLLDIYQEGLANMKHQNYPESLVEMNSPEKVYQRIHGQDSNLVSEKALGGIRRWNMGYCNLEDAFIDAKECIRVYYERCLAQPSISFECGVPVQRLCIAKGRATGVLLENGRILSADLTLIAAGAWSNALVYLEGWTLSSAIEVAWIKLTDDEVAQWKDMAITTNLSTGFNLFPPYNGEIKCLRRSAGYRNTVSIPHPEDPNLTIKTSLPRTIITNPKDVIPIDAESALRDNLREIMPQLADRPFNRTKLCWISQTPSSDFIIAPHPRIAGIHVATGGSAHAWKFFTVIGDKVLDSMEGNLDKELATKWAWTRKVTDGRNSHRMAGNPKELRQVIPSRI